MRTTPVDAPSIHYDFLTTLISSQKRYVLKAVVFNNHGQCGDTRPANSNCFPVESIIINSIHGCGIFQFKLDHGLIRQGNYGVENYGFCSSFTKQENKFFIFKRMVKKAWYKHCINRPLFNLLNTKKNIAMDKFIFVGGTPYLPNI